MRNRFFCLPVAFLTFICITLGCVMQMADAADALPALAPTTGLSNQDVTQRLDTATNMLQSQERSADYWEYGWGAFNGATMLGNAYGASRSANPENRNTDIIQATESLIGLSDTVFRPLPAFGADSVCSTPMRTPQDRADCLTAKQDLLQRSAERAQEPYEVLPHVSNLAFNAIAGILIARLGNAHNAFNAAIPGAVIGEVRLWTMPQEPTSDYHRYQVQFSPLLQQQSDRTKDTAAGLRLSMNF